MLAKVLSGANLGMDSVLVTTEVDIASQGLPSFTIVGLADRAIEEAKDRVRSALKNSGADLPSKKITVNLAPADLPKEGPSFDLPIAVGILQASGQLAANLEGILMVGELSLDGSLRSTHGVLSYVLLAQRLKVSSVFVPRENVAEARIVEGIDVFGFESLLEVFQFLNKSIKKDPEPKMEINLEEKSHFEFDFKDIKGQNQAKRALEIAAAGGHNILMSGPPGSGKTLLSRSFPSILPPMTLPEAIDVTKIYSVSGNLNNGSSIVTTRPFRSPHHTASYVGIIGGGNSIKPGEISLAHRGVLFLDELPEFSRQVLEALRQPLEDHIVTISRANGSLTFPCEFMLLGACNPCPCGFLGSVNKKCVCMPGQISRYKKKLSGPLIDRIDIHLEVPQVEMEKLTDNMVSESSGQIRERVKIAREIQEKRFKDEGILTNSQMGNVLIKKYCAVSSEALELLKMAISQMNLSARGYHRTLKLSRTIADLERSENIQEQHIAEALTYRAKEN